MRSFLRGPLKKSTFFFSRFIVKIRVFSAIFLKRNSRFLRDALTKFEFSRSFVEICVFSAIISGNWRFLLHMIDEIDFFFLRSFVEIRETFYD